MCERTAPQAVVLLLAGLGNLLYLVMVRHSLGSGGRSGGGGGDRSGGRNGGGSNIDDGNMGMRWRTLINGRQEGISLVSERRHRTTVAASMRECTSTGGRYVLYRRWAVGRAEGYRRVA